MEHLGQRNLATRYAGGEITLQDVSAAVLGWINHVRYGNTIGLRKKVLTRHPLKPPGVRGPAPAAVR